MSLFQEVYKLYYRQMVAQLCISKEMSIFHKCFYINNGALPLLPLYAFMG